MKVNLSKTMKSLKIIYQGFTEFLMEIFSYYLSLYPLQLFVGIFRKILRRLKYCWLPKGKGRPRVSQYIIDLIIEMKKLNPLWGGGTITPMRWGTFFKLHKNIWAIDFTCIMDFKGIQYFIFVILDKSSRVLICIKY